ncbi:hypothetical protein [Dickeya zeae]|uniref:hypothetical protein n=1 Tax=Dickeya zeae TaxID=204042 RepID=UPI001F0EB2A1|nr:hypothetical protein [Dickeya zeae]
MALYDGSLALYGVYHQKHAWLSAFANTGRSGFDNAYRTLHNPPQWHTWLQYSSQFGGNTRKEDYGVSAGLAYAFK